MRSHPRETLAANQANLLLSRPITELSLALPYEAQSIRLAAPPGHAGPRRLDGGITGDPAG